LPIRNPPAIHLGAPGEEISRKSLQQLGRRFLLLHRQRLTLLSKCLNRRQRDCLEVLPLLFHHSHPALPGFGDGLAPAGISEYRSSPATRQAIRRIAPGFDYRRRGIPDAPILALFLMGSAGSVAWSERSDLDLWICHRSDLEPEALELLQRKCRQIERWAEGRDLEIHCFLIDPERFRQGHLSSPLSPDSSGSTQHVLLLEEFYRTAIHLAGLKLLWWMVPPEQERHYRTYADYLLGKRFIDPPSFIDLGGLATIPAREFVSAGMWHLYKALDSPYKALLKLQLLLCYADEYPVPHWIATEIKQEIFAGRIGSANLDPYLRLYHKVEGFLDQQGQNRLRPLIQRCFIMKTRHALQHPHLRSLLEELLRQWGWSARRITTAQLYPRTFEELRQEWQSLVETLEQGYQSLRRFHFNHSQDEARDSEELRILGRKLGAVLEKRPGKVEVVHLSTPLDLTEASLSLARENPDDDSPPLWIIRRGQFRGEPQQVLHQTRHVIEAIAWAQANQIAGHATHWDLPATEDALRPAELRYLCQTTRRFLGATKEAEIGAYRSRARILRAALFPNIATPTRPQRSDYAITSERFDPLAFGARRDVLIHNLEILVFTSWGELQVKYYQGLAGLFDALCLLCNQAGPDMMVEAHCFASRTIAMRIAELYQALQESMGRDQDSLFVLGAGASLYLFQRRNGTLSWWEQGDEAALLDTLGKPKSSFGQVYFDSHALEDSPLPTLFRENLANCLQLFLQAHPKGVEIFALDERGALFRYFHPGAPLTSVALRYTSLFEALDRRYAGIPEAQLYRLERYGRHWKIRSLTPEPCQEKAIDVRVYAEENTGPGSRYTLVCNEREFSTRASGDSVFQEAAGYIRQLRRKKADYPLYISDIDVPPSVLGVSSPEGIHTTLLLHYKQKLEQRLNQA